MRKQRVKALKKAFEEKVGRRPLPRRDAVMPRVMPPGVTERDMIEYFALHAPYIPSEIRRIKKEYMNG